MTTVPEAERSTGLDRDGGTELIFDGLTISNGLGWSIDGSTMYLVDSCPPVIHGFAFDAERGTIADGRILVTVAEDVGVPDGMTVDADGDLWVAIYGGGRVQRYSSAGQRQGAHRRRSPCHASPSSIPPRFAIRIASLRPTRNPSE